MMEAGSANSHPDDTGRRVNPPWAEVFHVGYPGATAALILVSRSHVTRDTITLRATTRNCANSESAEDALAAADGGHCREGDGFTLDNWLRSAFNNTDTANRARGNFACENEIGFFVRNRGPQTMTDATVPNAQSSATCHLAVVNNDLGMNVGIDDAWVGDANSTTEAEFYAIGIDLTGKAVSSWSDAPGYGVTAFGQLHDNATFKRLLQNNPWGELKFKVEIVTQAEFDALP